MNSVKQEIVLKHLRGLTLRQLTELIQKTIPGKNFTFGTSELTGDVRVVSLPNIAAVSEFDELMEDFKSVHGLTHISSGDADK